LTSAAIVGDHISIIATAFLTKAAALPAEVIAVTDRLAGNRLR
jgi:hypothetical protein